MDNIYDFEKRLKSIEESISGSKHISKENKKLIFKFKDECHAKSLSLARIIRHLYCLRELAKWINKDFNKAKTQDIKKVVAEIEMMSKYSPRTKLEYKSTLKGFYKWLKNNEEPKEVNWINLTFKMNNHKLPSELLTEEEIKEMVNKTPNPRDRAIIMGLYESGCRIGEFIKIKIKHISFDNYGALLDVTGKTGGRRVRVITASPYILEWINKHPEKNNPDAYLWIKNHGSQKMFAYPAFNKMLRVVAERAKIKKRVNPHNFRHARATYLASKLTEQQLKIVFGWTRASNMAAIYVHLSGRDVDNALLELYGMKKDEKQEPKLQLIECIRCGYKNEPTGKFCGRCTMILDKEEANKVIKTELERKDADKFMDKLIKDPEILALIKKKLA